MKKNIISLVIIAVSITACSSNEIKPTVKPKPVVKKIVKKVTPKVVVKKPIVIQPSLAVRKQPRKRIVRNYMARGFASKYRLADNGIKTASGEIYDLYGMTAAHASLPFLSKVMVKNLRNGRSVVVTITDRLYDNSKLIKLSYWAARKLNLIKHPSRRVLVKSF